MRLHQPLFGFILLGGFLVNGNPLAVFTHALEADTATLEGEEGIVVAAAHVGAGVDFGAALADKNITGQDKLTVCTFRA